MKNLNHLVALLQEGYTTVGVVFNPEAAREVHFDGAQPAPWSQTPQRQQGQQKQYTYKCQFADIKVGDLVVLPPSTGKLPSIGVIARVDVEPELNFESDIEYKWLMAKVDDAAYLELLNKEQKMISLLRESERAKQRKELVEAYQLTLPQDAASRKMFDEVRQIGNGPIIEA